MQSILAQAVQQAVRREIQVPITTAPSPADIIARMRGVIRELRMHGVEPISISHARNLSAHETGVGALPPDRLLA